MPYARLQLFSKRYPTVWICLIFRFFEFVSLNFKIVIFFVLIKKQKPLFYGKMPDFLFGKAEQFYSDKQNPRKVYFRLIVVITFFGFVSLGKAVFINLKICFPDSSNPILVISLPTCFEVMKSIFWFSFNLSFSMSMP